MQGALPKIPYPPLAPRAGQWLAGSLLLADSLARSGGFFVHMGLGRPGRSSPGTALTRTGALLLAAAPVILASGLVTHG